MQVRGTLWTCGANQDACVPRCDCRWFTIGDKAVGKSGLLGLLGANPIVESQVGRLRIG